MGSFSKMAIFLFCTIGFFALLFSLIPPQFFVVSHDASIGVDKEIAEYFSASNVTMYSTSGHDNMTYEYSSYHDHPDYPQFPTGASGEWLEVWWSSYIYLGIESKGIEFRHIHEMFWWEELVDRLNFKGMDMSSVGIAILKNEMESYYDSEINGSAFYADCQHLSTSVIFGFNQTTYSNISDAWDGGEISYVLSYEPNWNASSVSAATVVWQLLTFQNPDLGIEGDAGTILNFMIGAPFIVMTAILILLIIQSLVPFIRGIDA